MFTTIGLVSLACLLGYTFLIDEFQSDNKLCDYKELNTLTGEGISISKNIRLSNEVSTEHILMVAPSGSGKSRRFMMPNVNNLKNCSIIVTDPSGEIQKTCHPNKKEYIFSPFSDKTIGYNPLTNCKNEFEVRKIAGIMLQNGMVDSKDNKQQEWVDMAKPLLSAYMLMCWHTKKYDFDQMIFNVCTKPIMPEYRMSKDKNGNEIKVPNPMGSIVEDIMNSECNSAIADLQMFMQVMNAQQTLSSIRIVMNTCLQMFMDDNLETMFSVPSIDLSKIRKEECIVYIQIPERHSEYYKPLVATFVNQLLDCFLDNDGLQVYMLFDEFCNIGKIPNICSVLSTIRKHNVSIVAAIQNITQLTRRYGEIDGKELQELFKTILICSGLKDSAEYFAKIVGKKKVKRNKQTSFEDVMSAEQIRCMERDNVLILSSNKRPVLDKMLGVVC